MFVCCCRYIIDKDFPGMRISPEPTTDHFHVVDYGDEDGRIPGNVLAFDNKKSFTQLQQFGGKFLQKFECSTTKSDVLKSLCLVDTPGKSSVWYADRNAELSFL